MTPEEQELLSRYQLWKEVMDVSESGNNDPSTCRILCVSCPCGCRSGD